MDKESAKLVLKNTFRNSFDMDNFECFLTELFNTSHIQNREIVKFKKEFKDYVEKFYKLGHYNDDFGDSIGFYVVQLKNASLRDRARTMQRNLIAGDMGEKHNMALVAFYETNSDDWRFSFIKKEYKLSDKGLETNLSSPKRHSFLVGVNEPNHTCQKQFLDLLISEENLELTKIENAFDIENVTGEFFKKYKELYWELIDSLNDVKEKDSIVNEEFTSKNIESSDFAKKLMGQIVFLYFLQKKGWLGVSKEGKWGTGPKNFLRKIFDKSVNEDKNFFNDVLEHLFYEGLSEEVSDYHFNQFGYKVPFLNGGLFEPINNYDWRETEVNLKNNIFSNILDTFDKFNFTVKEDEPLEKEVAVDPEMLGKVFESLLEVKDRKSKGAFYTPRNIVHFMCQENLIQYLKTNTNISEKDLRQFITKGDLAVNTIIRANEEKRKYKGKQYTKIQLSNSIKDNADELENLLRKVKVVDPAVGSGAFPVGMMNEIVKARYILRLLNGIDNVNMYNLKRETIENSLYGVDLEQSATDVTKLRFWLSLIVDEEDIDNIRPLPNLDNQIICGNSVIDGYNNIKLFDDNLIVRSEQQKLSMTETERTFYTLESKKKEYFDSSSHNRKEKLKNEINTLKWNFIETLLKEKQDKAESEKRTLEENFKNNRKNKKKLKNKNNELNNIIKTKNEIQKYKNLETKPFFIWELEFSEIFKGKNPGFDIVIGNPPYVRQEKIKEIKPYLENNYETYTGVADLYVYFFEKGLNILKDKGIFAFICSNKFAKADYGEKLRELILNNQLLIYNDFTGVKVFKEASVDTCVIQIKKDFVEDNEVYVDNKYYMEQKRLNSKSFIFNTPEVLNLRDKIFNQGTMIKDLDIQINYGIKTGFNDAFIIDEETKNRLIKEDSKNKEIIKPLLRGKDIKKWRIQYNNLYLIFTRQGININKYPSIKEYLGQYRENLTPKNKNSKKSDKGRKPGPYKWYEIQDSIAYYSLFEKEKIIYSTISPEPSFAYDDNNNYILDSGFILNSNSINIKYLIALLNSKLLFWYFKDTCYSLSTKGFQYKKIFVEQIPIKTINKNMEKELCNLVNKILEFNKIFINETNFLWNYILKEFKVQKISNKLENYFKLNSEEFLKEIKKQNGVISNEFLKDALIQKFNFSCQKIEEIQLNIEYIEKELNKLIYLIYNLDENEINIVENELKKFNTF